MSKKPREELAALLDANTRPLVTAINDLGRAIVEGDREKRSAAKRRVARILGETLALVFALGARRVGLLARRVARADVAGLLSLRLGPASLIPHVPFEDAVVSVLTRTPTLADGDVQRWLEVAEIVRDRHGFALAHAVDEQVTSLVQGVVADALATGATHEEAVEAIQAIGDFSRSYAETVYRTNAATAYEAGTWKAAMEVDDEVIDGLVFVTAGDADVRPNHRVLDGVRGHKREAFWARVAPPVGYNCRCTLEPISADELRRQGRRPPPRGWRPESPAFQPARPDQRFLGAVGL